MTALTGECCDGGYDCGMRAERYIAEYTWGYQVEREERAKEIQMVRRYKSQVG